MRLKYNVKRVAYILIICVFVLLCICLILFNQTKAVIARIRIGEPADHNWQGFSNIMGCKIDDIATFSNSDESELYYVVKDMFEGSVDENGLLLDNEGAQFLQSDPTNIILTIRILLMLSSRHRRCFFGW